MHRSVLCTPDRSTALLEEMVGAMATLRNRAKPGTWSLSEASPNTILGPHAVHPISALQSEFISNTRA